MSMAMPHRIEHGAVEGKYFTSSPSAASSYAKEAVQAFGDPPYTTVSTPILTELLPTPVSVDGGIPAYVIPDTVLPSLKPTVLPYMSLP